MSGYSVTPEHLDSYSQRLTGHMSAVERVKGMVEESDVSDESWGVVGLLVKGQYTDMLGDFNSLLDELRNGLQSGSDKIKNAAERYRTAEQENQRRLKEILSQLNAVNETGKAT
ncbi:type VII secretion target [Saccharomonospora xinjiangensis]|uniref:type VII secretion target n=1 Tax=Saccharomonospora xinjiangensis TaxID=75294 RepID=UPI00350F60DB